MTILRVNSKEIALKGILFDKDGTLVDFLYTWGYWVELMLDHFSQALAGRGLPVLSEDIYAALGVKGNTQQGIHDYDRQGPLSVGSLQDLLTILSLQGYERGLTWAQARLLAAESQELANERLEAERRIQVLPGILEFLQQCKQLNLKLAVVTADDTKPAQQQLAWLGLENTFDAVIGHDSAARGKPYPDMVYLACQQLELSPAEVVMIGDTNGDMMMAKAAGVNAAIAYLSNHALATSDYPDADECIYSYSDLQLFN